MFNRLNRSIALGMVLAGFASVATADEPPAGTLVLKQHTFKDPGSGNMASHTVLVPEGWKAEGGAYWPPSQLFRVHPSQRVTVTAPNGTFVRVSPIFAASDFRPSPYAVQQLGARRPAERSIDNGTPVVYMPDSLEAWQRWVRKHGVEEPFRGAKNIAFEPVVVVPELTEYLRKKTEPMRRQQEQENRQWQMMGARSRAFCDSTMYAARCTYEHEGRAWEQLWVWGVGIVGQDTEVGRQIWWIMEPITTFRAPKGKLRESMPVLMTIANSVRMTLGWARMKAKHLAKMQQIDIEGFAKRAQMQAQFADEMRTMIQRSWERRQAARDTGHYHFIQSIKETRDYVVPNANEPPIQLPIHYNHVWRSETGRVVLTNDANYDPGIGSTETWKQMEPASP